MDRELLQVSHIQKGRLRGVLSVDIKDFCTVEDLKNVISNRFELSRLTLYYRGVNLDEHEQLVLKHLIPDLQKMGAPRFSARSILHSSDATELSLVVVRKFLNGLPNFQVDLPARSTVADLEQAISDHEGGIDQGSCRLLFNGVQLFSDVELTEYNLVSGDAVYFGWRLRGSGGAPTVDFVDMEKCICFENRQSGLLLTTRMEGNWRWLKP
ncbi:hypothetical protein M758_1G254600 [Ceratodon purpureus]|nr:hypothetical protein M758_1G254600 [Ceratodon purpureus]